MEHHETGHETEMVNQQDHGSAGWGRAAVAIGLGVAAGLVAAGMARRMLSSPTDLAGKRVLIMGGSRGLGFELAREFVGRGARVAICARDRIELSRAHARIMRPVGGLQNDDELFAMVCDVTDRESVERVVRTVEQRLGGIDILVNNAGVITLGPLETMTIEDFEYTMKVQFWGPLYATLAALPGMKMQGGGQIVNISSIGGKIGVPQLAPYCASKFAIQGLSESLNAELRREGIAVTAICPGIMRTGGHLNAMYKGRNREGFAWMNAFNIIPGMSVSAEYAAQRIVDAAAKRDSEVVIGAPAKIADKIHAMFPGIFTQFESLAARLLPAADGEGSIGRSSATGLESEPGVLPRWMKGSIYRTAERHNQFPGARRTGVGHDDQTTTR